MVSVDLIVYSLKMDVTKVHIIGDICSYKNADKCCTKYLIVVKKRSIQLALV